MALCLGSVPGAVGGQIRANSSISVALSSFVKGSAVAVADFVHSESKSKLPKLSDFAIGVHVTVPSERFANRPATVAGPMGNLPVLAFLDFHTLLRVSDSPCPTWHLPFASHAMLPFPCSGQGRHNGNEISELNTWPALPLGTGSAQHEKRCYHAFSHLLPEAEVDATAVLRKNFHSLSKTGFIPAHLTPFEFFFGFFQTRGVRRFSVVQRRARRREPSAEVHVR